MAHAYKLSLQILEKWPICASKKNRDLGEFIRDQFKLAFKDKQFLFGSEFECNRNLESLKRLSENYHGNKYKRTLDSSSTGLTAEECKQIMSNEFLNENRK